MLNYLKVQNQGLDPRWIRCVVSISKHKVAFFSFSVVIYMPLYIIVWEAFSHTSSHSVRRYYIHFMDKKTEVHRDDMIFWL